MSPPNDSRAGYALPAVLTVVTILTLIFMVCILSLESLRAETLATVKSDELERAALTAEARFAFLAATEPMNANSLQIGGVRLQAVDILTGRPPTAPILNGSAAVVPLRLDGRSYAWREANDGTGPSYVASAQDLAGLINLDRIDSGPLARLLTILGVGEDSAGRIADRLIAYRSPSTQSSFERSAEIRPVARDGLMRRYFETFGVSDFVNALTAQQRRRLLDLTFLEPDAGTMNINTAPADVLQAWFGLSHEDAIQIVSRRTSETFSSTNQIGVVTSNDFGAYTFPNGRFRFNFSAPGGQTLYRSSIVMTPGSFERPFWVEDARVQPSIAPTPKTLDALQPFPAIPRPAAKS